jgi:hypothetical protein
MKTYFLKFGSGDPAPYTGLTPTMTIFSVAGLTAITAPSISEAPTGSGLYKFQYGPTLPIIFKVDGGGTLNSTDRYITGVLDPIQAVDERIGTIDDSFGSTASDPSTTFGYVKRIQEFLEGNAVFTKSTGTWDIYSRGSSTLLREKTLANTITSATKT